MTRPSVPEINLEFQRALHMFFNAVTFGESLGFRVLVSQSSCCLVFASRVNDFVFLAEVSCLV